MIGQIVSLLGAAMILVAFAAQQARKLSSDSAAYLALNFAGAAIMTYFAIASKSSGLIALEGSWAAISLVSLVRAVGRRTRQRS
ncbi:MAG TPA: hypothetical protein VH854_00110 [Thermoanaerobaculia bacterium]|nr:hypothetical protein [Thermoanaerobaculia bacterium]